MMSQASPRKGRQTKGAAKQKEILGLLEQAYRERPQDLWATFPEIAAALADIVSPPRKEAPHESLLYTYLSEKEKAFRIDYLKALLAKKDLGQEITSEDIHRALGHLAALREAGYPYKEQVIALAFQVLSLPRHPEKKVVHTFLKGVPKHHTYEIQRGITLVLSWDKRAIQIELDPQEMAVRERLLSVAGIGEDTQRDVAQRHDDYLAEALHGE